MFKHSLSVFAFCLSFCLLLGLQVAIASFPSNARPSLFKRNQIGTNSRTIMKKRSIVEKGTLDHFIKRSEHKGTKYNEMLAPGPLFAPQPQPQPKPYKLMQTASTSQILKKRSIVEQGTVDRFVKRVEHKYSQMLPGAPAPAPQPQPQPKPQWPKPWWMPPKKRDEKKHEVYGQLLAVDPSSGGNNVGGSHKRSIEEGKQ